MEIIPDKRKLIDLVGQAADGRLCLPNFQREFVWRREEVADLVRSILRGYFIGSLLLLRCEPGNPPFAPRAIRGATPPKTTLTPDLLILDGQQRLTSTLYALTAPDLGLKNSKSPRLFFVDLDLMLTDPDDEDVVVDKTARDAKRDGLDTPEGQYVRHMIPCTALLDSKSFLQWRDGLDDWLRETRPDDHKTFRDVWRDAWTDIVSHFQEFQVPLVELPTVADDDDEAIGRVCAIFEKLNATGQALSVYDLLTARLYRSNINLHDLWDEACGKHKLLNDWSGGNADEGGFGVLVLRTVALMRNLEPKPNTLINLKPKDFEEDWRAASAAMEKALNLLQNTSSDGLGVFAKKWLPGGAQLPVLAALRAHIDERRLGAAERDALRRWYWCSVFMERYSGAVVTKSRRDYSEMIAYWTGKGGPPSVFAEAQARIGASGYTIRDSASHASAVYSGVFCLLALRGARDWQTDEAISLHQLEDHHIFPQAVLKRHGYRPQLDKREINSIVNRTLISGLTNGKISDAAPADYILDPKVFDVAPQDVLPAHFVDVDALAALRGAAEELDNADFGAVYDAFRDARERTIIGAIREVCGVKATGEPAPEGYEDALEFDIDEDQ